MQFKKIKNPILRTIIELAVAIAFAMAVALLFVNFIMRGANIDGSSMEPTFNHKDKVFTSKIPYYFNAPQPGDVVIFPSPVKEKDVFVKRIIGLPGDEVSVKDGCICINAEKIDDSFGVAEAVESDIQYPYIIPENSYFVLGDNRPFSHDSRYSDVNLIPKSKLMGKVIFRYWPFDKSGVIE